MTTLFKKKRWKSDFKAINYTFILSLALILTGLFSFSDFVEAQGFNESFEYSTGILTGQGGWELAGGGGENHCWVDSIRAFDGLKSISVQDGWASCGARKDIATTTTGFFSIYFYGETKETGNNILYYLGTGSYISLNNDNIRIGPTTVLPGSENWNTNRWHKIGIEVDTIEGIGRAKFDDFQWSATTTIPTDPITSLYISYQNGYRNEQDFFMDFIQYDISYSDYTYETMGLEELPGLESCEGLGITEGFLCEIRNFFTRLFVPTPEKINELKNTLNLVKERFPYSYILAFQDFFSYLGDNISEGQDIEFSILGQTGEVSFGFWNSTTTLAGGVQNFLGIFKTFFKFLLVVLLGLWLFSVLKRIFK